MANTRETLGDQATLDGLVNHTLTSLEEDGVTNLRSYALYGQGNLTSVKMPNLTSAGRYSFQNCTGITTIDDTDFQNLATVNSYAFQNCTGLTNVELPSVTTIDSSAFAGCSNLETVETGEPKTSFVSPFSGCPKLKNLIVNSTQMSTLSNSTVLSSTAIGSYQGAVFVPDELVDTYKANSNWKNYLIISKNSYPVSDFSPYVEPIFSSITDSWAEIIANDDYATDYPIGSTKMVDLGEYGYCSMELVAIDADERADGDTTNNNGKARMTWISKDVITTHNMNDSNTNANGWPSTAMRSWLRSDVWALLPEVLRNNIVEVTKTYYDYTTSSTKTGTDTIWIPSIREMFGGTSGYTEEDSGVTYTSKFNSNNARVKKLNGSASYWWLRSAYSSVSSNFYYVYGSGNSSFDYGGANYAYGVAPGFCI